MQIDDSIRIKLREASKNLSNAMEIHSDTVHRIGYSALQLYMARVGYDSMLWTDLAESKKHVLRYYQSFRMLAQPQDDAYVANNVTKALAGPSGMEIEYFTTVMQKPFEAVPRYLKSHNFQNPTNPVDFPWQEGYNSKDHPFVVAQNTDKVTVIFVDVGSVGHQSIGLRERFPDLPDRIIIQDTSQVIEMVQPSHDIEPQIYDFFMPQPVKEDSVILIDDMVFLEKGAPWRAIQFDMTMMATLSALERSENQWYVLLDRAGLEVVKIWKYSEECDDCIIVAKPKKVP
ncbi:S-adenosyl-L-methionine-dependent methyltransferase [Lentithecium fluviatile CBS 122367]|uniref:S-adenosyl-L-methionine-dependent methyltransferase n=1 Tax=Lentithecium fluviatile CBS 122367 TaxID=1168545 RepID=A0A6G1JDV2_9PLEO|nr:S-adenosyl-L-methionine-dependent methyltransferase [Lentithecium fluviatile CBS 122367]